MGTELWTATWTGRDEASGEVLWDVRDASSQRIVRTSEVDLASVGRAACRALGRAFTEEGPYHLETTTHEHGDVYELETTYYWFVVDTAKDAPAMVFWGDDFQKLGSEGWGPVLSSSGVADVVLAGREVLVREGKEVRCVPVATDAEARATAAACWKRQGMRL